MKSPCRKGCAMRNADCHCVCEAYQAYWQEKLKEYGSRKLNKNHLDFDFEEKRRIRKPKQRYCFEK